MKAELKITDLKHSYVQHGLERLAKFHIGARLWNRMRFDDAFAHTVSTALHDAYIATPGIRYTATFDRHYTRFELRRELTQAGITPLAEKIIASLLPVDPKQGQQELIDNPYEAEWFVVEPGYRMDEDAVRAELAYRGVAPCTTEEGLSFMLAHTRASIPQSIVVLDAWREVSGTRQFLELGHSMSGHPGLWMVDLPPTATRFLAKKALVPRPDPES